MGFGGVWHVGLAIWVAVDGLLVVGGGFFVEKWPGGWIFFFGLERLVRASEGSGMLVWC